MTRDLAALRASVNLVLVPLLWMHVPLVAAVSWATGTDWLLLTAGAAAFALVSTVCWAALPSEKTTRLTIAVSLVAMVSLILAACQGSAWQVDIHMYYFATLAILAAYCDRDVILAAAGLTAIHHLCLNLLAPALVFPGGSQLGRVVLHAVIVVLETGVLVWMAQRIVTAFGESAQHLASAVDALDAARALEAEMAQVRARQAAEDEEKRAAAEAAAALANRVVDSIGAGLNRLAAGDLTLHVDEPLPAMYEKLRLDLNATADQLRSAIGVIANASRAVLSGTAELAIATDNLGRRTEQQAASLEQTAAALQVITSTVGKAAAGAREARDVAGRTKAEADCSGQVVQNAVATMSEIERSSQQIGQIVGVIDELAFQTNLLALNAGVEAARAGDAGRGFAVVASEVRALAQRSAEAAREIKGLILNSTRHVDAGVKIVDETGRSLARIAAQVIEIEAMVRLMASSAEEQASGLQEVNEAVNQMDQVTQQNAAMVEESTAATQEVARRMEELARLAGRFRLDDTMASPGGGNEPKPRGSFLPPSPSTRPRPPRLQVVTGSGSRDRSSHGNGWEEF